MPEFSPAGRSLQGESLEEGTAGGKKALDPPLHSASEWRACAWCWYVRALSLGRASRGIRRCAMPAFVSSSTVTPQNYHCLAPSQDDHFPARQHLHFCRALICLGSATIRRRGSRQKIGPNDERRPLHHGGTGPPFSFSSECYTESRRDSTEYRSISYGKYRVHVAIVKSDA